MLIKRFSALAKWNVLLTVSGVCRWRMIARGASLIGFLGIIADCCGERWIPLQKVFWIAVDWEIWLQKACTEYVVCSILLAKRSNLDFNVFNLNIRTINLPREWQIPYQIKPKKKPVTELTTCSVSYQPEKHSLVEGTHSYNTSRYFLPIVIWLMGR